MQKLVVSTLFAVGLLSSTLALADKIAVIDVQKAAEDTNYMKAQKTSLEAAIKPQQQKQEALAKQIQSLRQKAQTDAKVMKEADLKKLEQDFATKMNEYNANASGMQKRLQDTLENINRTLSPKIEAATEELRKAGGYSAVLNKSMVISNDAAIDITAQVTQKVNSTLK